MEVNHSINQGRESMNLHNYILARDVYPSDVKEAKQFIETIFGDRSDKAFEIFDNLGGNENYNMPYARVLEPELNHNIPLGYSSFTKYMKEEGIELSEGDDTGRRIKGKKEFDTLFQNFKNSSLYPEEQ